MKITFIGGGNMARSLIGGLLESGTVASNIVVADPQETTLRSLATDLGITPESSNTQAITNADVVVLAVKPQQMHTVLSGLSGQLNGKLIVSIAAGVMSADIAKWAGDDNACVVRCMPNTPALLGCGATGLYAGDQVPASQRQQAEAILNTAGISYWVDTEEQLDAVTALSGSGPAYFFLLMEAMTESAEKLGLPTDIASRFAIQTALGAARMASEGDIPPAQLRRNVTSPAGTTERALNSFTNDQFGAMVHRAMQAAGQRAQELGEELGANHG